MKRCSCLTLSLAMLFAGPALGAGAVGESARKIPLAYDVDVVVVGGTTGGVAAAVAAAKQGAKVFLAAPRPYLGEDMCATYRLWLDPGETPNTPLAKAMFARPQFAKRLDYSYQADQPSAGVHKDSVPPAILNDGQWGNAYNQSVQYNRDVTISIDLGEKRRFKAIHVMAFQGPRSYEVQSVVVSASDDKRQWRTLATVPNPKLDKGSFVHSAIDIAARVAGEARYLKVLAKKTKRAQRALIGEIVVEAQPMPGEEQGVVVTTPMQVKLALDQALLDAGVSFLYGCFATDVLRDASGELAGIVMANRAGRQAVRAKVIVDATPRATVARMAGAQFARWPAGPQTFKRIVVGGAVKQRPGLQARRIRLRYPIGGKPPIHYGSGTWAVKKNYPMREKFDEIIEYTLSIPMQDASSASFAEAEQVARDWTFDPKQLDDSDSMFQVPPDPVRAQARLSGPWPGAGAADLAAFEPRGVKRLHIVGGCGDVPRDAAARLLRPLELMALGSRIGAEAAAEAKTVGQLTEVRLRGKPAAPAASGDTREFLAGTRPTRENLGTIDADARSVPVLGEYDVVVVGGGTGGAPAGVAAARQGAKTLVVEYLHGLGGVSTMGLIGIYCAGYRKGFTAETEAGVAKLGATSYVVGKMEWWRREIRRPGGDIWFGALGCGAFVEGKRVKGVVVATPQGRGVVLANAVIDGTGNADVAAAAGAPCMYDTADHIALQGAGLPQREPGASYINTDWTFVDETDMVDVWSAFVVAKRRFSQAYDLGQLIDTRERRRIVGDYILTPLDIINHRTFPDTVGIANGGRLDKHGYTVHEYYTINNYRGGISYTPYRCLLPKGWDGILAIGLGVSAHQDAIPSIRMQPGVQNLGYAAGAAAAMARDAGSLRAIDIKALQRYLVSKGCLTPDVLKHADSFPLPSDKVEAAVRMLATKDYSSLGVILATPDVAIPLMRAAYSDAATSAHGKLRCAHVLGLLGDAAGIDALIAKVRSFERFDKDRIDNYFPCITWLDSYIIALGKTRDPRALTPVLEKLALLADRGSHRFSHYRAVALALESIGDPAAAKPLARLLQKRRLTNSPVTTIDQAIRQGRGKSGQRDLILARALYRCGDYHGVGEKVLRQYVHDVRGHFARHAQAVLAQGRGPAK